MLQSSYVDPRFHEAVYDSLPGAGGRAQGGGSEAKSPGVVMETKLKALVTKLSAIHKQVCLDEAVAVHIIVWHI